MLDAVPISMKPSLSLTLVVAGQRTIKVLLVLSKKSPMQMVGEWKLYAITVAASWGMFSRARDFPLPPMRGTASTEFA